MDRSTLRSGPSKRSPGSNWFAKISAFEVRRLGRDAIGEVNLEVEHKGRSYRGVGVSTDSVESTILAMLNAINRIVAEKSTQAG